MLIREILANYSDWQTLLNRYQTPQTYINEIDYNYIIDIFGNYQTYTQNISEFKGFCALKWNQLYPIYLQKQDFYNKKIAELNNQKVDRENKIYAMASNSFIDSDTILTPDIIKKYLDEYSTDLTNTQINLLNELDSINKHLSNLTANAPYKNLIINFVNTIITKTDNIKIDINYFWQLVNGKLLNITNTTIDNNNNSIENVKISNSPNGVVINSQLGKIINFDPLSINLNTSNNKTAAISLYDSLSKNYLTADDINKQLSKNKSDISTNKIDIATNTTNNTETKKLVIVNTANIGANKASIIGNTNEIDAVSKSKADKDNLPTSWVFKDGATAANISNNVVKLSFDDPSGGTVNFNANTMKQNAKGEWSVIGITGNSIDTDFLATNIVVNFYNSFKIANTDNFFKTFKNNTGEILIGSSGLVSYEDPTVNIIFDNNKLNKLISLLITPSTPQSPITPSEPTSLTPDDKTITFNKDNKIQASALIFDASDPEGYILGENLYGIVKSNTNNIDDGKLLNKYVKLGYLSFGAGLKWVELSENEFRLELTNPPVISDSDKADHMLNVSDFEIKKDENDETKIMIQALDSIKLMENANKISMVIWFKTWYISSSTKEKVYEIIEFELNSDIYHKTQIENDPFILETEFFYTPRTTTDYVLLRNTALQSTGFQFTAKLNILNDGDYIVFQVKNNSKDNWFNIEEILKIEGTVYYE